MHSETEYRCGGTYTCPRCEREFGWCMGAFDDTPALCDDCANEIQYEDDGESPVFGADGGGSNAAERGAWWGT